VEFFLGFIGLYFIPSFVVALRQPHRYSGPVYVINIFAGWTGIGWVVALALAAAQPSATTVIQPPEWQPPPPPTIT